METYNKKKLKKSQKKVLKKRNICDQLYWIIGGGPDRISMMELCFGSL